MEAFGFGVSVLSVVVAFESCVKRYSDIVSIRQRDEDVRATCMLVQIERRTFDKLREALRPNAHAAQRNSDPLVQGILQWIQNDLDKIHELCLRHSSSSTTGAPRVPVPGPGVGVGEGSADVRNRPSGSSKSSIVISTGLKKAVRNVAWVASDKQRLKDLVARLHQWNEGLATFLPEVKRQRISYETASANVASNSLHDLENVETATLQQHPLISQAAAVKRLTLRSRSNHIMNSDPVVLCQVKFRLSLRSFSWLSADQTSTTVSLDPSSNSLSASQASRLEKAYAMFSTVTGGQPSPSSVEGPVPVLVEWRDSFRSEDSLKQFEYRLDYLVQILRKMAGDGGATSTTTRQFRLFPCVGWVTLSPQFERIGLVFRLPQSPTPTGSSSIARNPLPRIAAPESLHQWIVRTRRDRLPIPALGRRFALAHDLVAAMGNLASVGWVHKELRSHNVVVVVPRGSGTSITDKAAAAVAPLEVCLTGFTYARPSGNADRDLSLLDSDPVYDLYRPSHHAMLRHQQRVNHQLQHQHTIPGPSQQPPSPAQLEGISEAPPAAATTTTSSGITRWTSAMDIYALGMILLEIGLWRTASSLKGATTAATVSTADFPSRTLDALVASLSYRVGERYMGVTRKYLKLVHHDDDDDDDDWWVDDEIKVNKFFADAIETLGACKA